jgi:hypothetical protein
MSEVLPVRAHSALGASSSSRWIVCPGSVTLARSVPDVETTYAKEGTGAHHVGEQSLLLDINPREFLGEVYEGVRVDEEMVDAVEVYTSYIQRRMELPSFQHMVVEERVDLGSLNPPLPMFGTTDCKLQFDGFMEVVDYKHGIGVYVEAKDNPQAKYYGLGSLLKWIEENGFEAEMPSPIVTTIVQPRIPSAEGLIRHATYKPDELLDWGTDTLLVAAQRTIDEPETYVPGEKQCMFCPAAGVCPALRETAIRTAQEEFGHLPAPEVLTPAQLSEILGVSKLIGQWVNAVEAYAYTQAEHGKPPPGWKLVPKRARKYWREDVDEGALVEMAEMFGLSIDEVAPRKLLTPAQFDKLTGVDPYEHYERISKGQNLVPDDDPTPDAKDAQDEFDVLN